MPDPAGRVEWLGEETSAGCTERSFLMRRPRGPVPGVLWSPQATEPRATALLFHGGSGHKRSERHQRMGRRLAAAGLAVIAIDGPYHGDRVPAGRWFVFYARMHRVEPDWRPMGRVDAS